MDIDKLLNDVAEHHATHSFNDDYCTPENWESRKEDGLGMAIAFHCEWDGLAIMRIFSAALEDANFHTESAQVDEMIEKVKNG